MARIEVARGFIDVVSAGAGPDLILLHSLLIDRSAFERVVPALALHRRVHLVALPGFEGSSPAGPAVEDYADRIAEACPALGLSSDTTVLGNGFGGFVAIALAARHGAQFGKLVLVDAAAWFPAPARSAFAAMAEKVHAEGMGAIAEIAARRIYHDGYLATHPEAVAQRQAVLMRFSPTAFITACRALQQVDLRDQLAHITNPTLVVVGEFDAATPVALAREVAQGIKKADFVLLPGCGHCPPLEQPQAFLASIGPFLGLPAG
jgi:pimeloyl-ACP methyl ester carboxylesterase